MAAGARRALRGRGPAPRGLLLICLAAHGAGGATRPPQEHAADAAGRRLQILVEDGWEFPAGIELAALTDLEDGTYGSGVGSELVLQLMAGYMYSGFVMTATGGDTFNIGHTDPTFRLVSEFADRDDCGSGAFFVSMGMVTLTPGQEAVSAFASGAAVGCTVTGGATIVDCSTIEPATVFMRGGTYQFCYSPSGVWSSGTDNIVPPTIAVAGVYSSCITDGCLQDERWECYFGYRAEMQGSCRIDVRTYGGRSGWGVVTSGESKVTWTAAWEAGAYVGDTWRDPDRQACAYTGDVASLRQYAAIVPNTDRFETLSTPFLVADDANLATMPDMLETAATSSFTLSVCYCPNYNSPDDATDELACTSGYEFIQPIGVVYFWMFNICDLATFTGCGTALTPYMRILPQQSFVLKLGCPSGACTATTNNRLKLISPDPLSGTADEKLSWEAAHRCKTTAAETGSYEWLPAEVDDMSGGTRQDYKVWADPYLMLKISTGSSMDVCYCDSDCDDEQNYFKVGAALTADSFGLARRTMAQTQGAVEPIRTIEYLNAAGSITLFGGVTSPLDSGMHPYDSIPFSRQALVKLISFDRDLLYTRNGSTELVTLEQLYSLDTVDSLNYHSQLDAACASTDYSVDLVAGPSDPDEAKFYVAVMHSDSGLDSRLPFSGTENDQDMYAKQAGTLAICYCAIVNEDTECSDSQYWIYANKLQIRGAAGGEQLTFPTNFVVRIQFSGWGFQETDTVRLIGTAQTCAENAYSPYAAGGFRLGCPGRNQSSCRLATLTENIETFLASSNTTGLYISRVEPGEHNTTLTFTGDITSVLSDGDAIVIDDTSVILNGNGKANWTTMEQYQVSRLSGIYSYADETENEGEGFTRELAAKVSYVYNQYGVITNQLVVPVGIDALSYSFSFYQPGGAWTRTSYLETSEEIKIETATEGQICWGAMVDGERKYYATVGQINFAEPARMADAGVHLTSRVPNMESQIVIAFAPNYGNAKYRSYDVPLVLRILFRDIDGMLTPLHSGALGESHEALDPELEVPMEGASQALCGKLFVEMWTNDAEGFPLPTGCYVGPVYQDKPSVDPYTGDQEATLPKYREYFIVFGSNNGLKSICIDYRDGRTTSCVYQLVLNAFIHSLTAVDADGNNQEPVSIFTLCANHSSNDSPCGPPYSVIEYGKARASRVTVSTDANGLELRSVDMSPLGSAKRGVTVDSPYELEESTATFGAESFAGTNLEFRAYPQTQTNPIRPGAFLRIFFFPLTIWDLGFTEACAATCISPPGHVCDDGLGGNSSECRLEQVVTTTFSATVQVQRNVLRLEYPLGMSTISSESESHKAHRLEVPDLRLPEFGYWTQAFMSQYTDQDDSSPSVVLVTERTYRIPPVGAMSAKLLVEGRAGSGNMPFVGNKGNQVIVRVLMGLTLSNPTEDGIATTPPPSPQPTEEPVTVTTTATSTIGDNDTDNGTDNGTNATTATTTATETESSTVTATSTVTTSTTELASTPAKLLLELPKGYTCSVVGNGMADPHGTQMLFQTDANGDGFMDYFRNALTSGTWSSSGRICTFTLDPDTRIWAGQVFYVLLSLYNPQEALLKDDPANVWLVNYTGANGARLGTAEQFISLADEALYPGWAGNLAVLTPLSDECLQPMVLERGVESSVMVFFRVTHSMTFYSYVVLDAPAGFDFGSTCSISDLDSPYYADWHSLAWGEDLTGPNSLTRAFGSNWTCEGAHWEFEAWDLTTPPTTNYTRAILRVGRAMPSGTLWGFRVQVKNSPSYDAAQHDGWKVWIRSPEGYPVDGSQYTLQFNAERIATVPDSIFDRSWGTYAEPLRNAAPLGFPASLHPTSVNQLSTRVTVYPIETSLDDDSLSSIRITAPVGYEWDLEGANGFHGYIDGVTCLDCVIDVTPQATYSNELTLPSVVLRAGRQYGFEALLKLPDLPPFKSMNAFFLEIGYDSDEGSLRMQAGVIEPPLLQVVYDVRVMSLCNVAMYTENVLEFRMTLTSAIPANGGFVFEGDESTRNSNIECWPQPLEGTLHLPEEASCSVQKHKVTKLPLIMLGAVEEGLPAGTYGFRFVGVTNANVQTGTLAYWKIGTYADLYNYPQMQVLDLAATVPASQLLGAIGSAGLLSAPEWEAAAMGRDDRPLAANKLTFYFSLASDMQFAWDGSDVILALRGPYGVVFEENCLGMLQTLPIGISNTSNAAEVAEAADDISRWPCSYSTVDSQTWCPSEISAWPEGLKFTSCVGIGGNTAKLSIPNAFILNLDSGFLKEKTFAFQVGLQNPTDNTTLNQWAIDVGAEASLAFESFTVHTFELVSSNLTATSHAVANASDTTEYLPVAILFTPHYTVPGRRDANGEVGEAEGELHVDAPAGFTLERSASSFCVRTLLEVAGRHPSDSDSNFEDGVDSDMYCLVPSDTQLQIRLRGSKALVAGTTYRLVLYVRNPTEPQPAASWRVHTYKTSATTDETLPLDLAHLDGFEVHARTTTWLVDNLAGEQMGTYTVFNVRATLQLGEHLYNGEYLTVSAPPGFLLDAGGGVCDGFAWTAAVIPLPSTEPVCSCDDRACQLTFDVDEGASGDVALEAGYLITFRLSTINPAAGLDETENWWTVTHGSAEGSVVETSVVASWTVYAQLLDLTLSTEVPLAAGSTTTMHIVFTPQAWGSSLELVVEVPDGFDFSGAATNPPIVVDDASTSGSTLFLVGGDFEEFVTTSVQVDNVVLGQAGGPVTVSVRLYDAGGQEVARRLNVYNVYRLPGELSVLDQQLSSQEVVEIGENGAVDPVLPMIPAQTSHLVRAELTFTSSVDMLPGEELILKSLEQPDTPGVFIPALSPAPGLTLCSGQDPATGLWKCNDTASVAVSSQDLLSTTANLEEDSYGISMTLAETLPAASTLRLRVWGTTASGAASSWELTVEDSEALAKSTNDLLDTAITTVAELTVTSSLEFRATETGCPPRSKVTVTLKVQAEQEPVTMLVLLPLGWAPESLNWQAGDSERYIVKVPMDSTEGDILGLGATFQLKAFSPAYTRADTRWFVFSYSRNVGSFGDTTRPYMLGWGAAPGFTVQNLPVAMMYPSIASHQGWLSLIFEVDNDITATYMLLTAPSGFVTSCPTTGLYANLVCSEIRDIGFIEVPGAGMLDNSLNVSLAGGFSQGKSRLFSFCVALNTPERETGNMWSLRLMSSTHAVVEAAIDIPGPPFFGDVLSMKPSMAWNPQPQQGEITTVTFEIEILQKIKYMHALLFSLPEMWRHEIVHVNQVKSLNKLWPVAVGIEWRYYQNLRWIRMLTDVSFSDSIDAVPSGVFQFQFPVRVPFMQPVISEWYLSFCSTIYCEAYDDEANIMAAFPVPNDVVSRDAEPFAIAMTASSRRPVGGQAQALAAAAMLAAALALRAG